MKDKSYRATPIGQLVGRCIRWCRNERGLRPDTIRAWEGMLARMSLTLAHLQPAEVTLDDLRTVIDLWADKEPRTRKNVTVAIRQFWQWVVDEGFADVSPATRLRYPKIPKRAPGSRAASRRQTSARRRGSHPRPASRLPCCSTLASASPNSAGSWFATSTSPAA